MTTKNSGTETAPDTLELENFLPYRLNVLAETVSQSLSRHYSDRYGISIPEWRVVATLGQFSSMTAKAVGAHSHMHKTKVSRAVAALEEKGMVKRKANPSDKREAFLRLTPKGQSVYDSFVPSALTFSDALASVLSDAERETFDIILARLIDQAEVLASETLGQTS
ncbi:MAG: transcriptional regulator [Hyphomicrobiales bacterium]|nr:MAG: transcriptional regulator [Hyphomicrobiales bacterium]